MQSEKLHDLYSSSNTMRLIKLRRIKFAGHVACMGETRNTHTQFWWGGKRKPLARSRSKGSIILK
jgi:hypothetical protein